MADCSQLPIRLAELTHKIASEDPTVRNLGDVVKRIQSKFPEVTRDQVVSDFAKLQGERRAKAQEKAAERANKEVNVARQIMKEANIEARDQERAKRLIESFQTLKKNPTKPNERKYMNARQQFLAEMVKSDRPWVNKLIKNADMEADLARFQKTGITKQEQADLIAKYAPKKRPESKSEAFNTAQNKADTLKAQIHYEILKAKPKTLGDKVAGAVQFPINFARAMMTSWDMGHLGRQGNFYLHAKPKMTLGAFGKSLSGMWSDNRYQTFMRNNVENHPHYDLARSNGVKFDDAHGVEWSEEIGSKMADLIPGVKWSKYAYAGFANKLRMDAFSAFVDAVPDATKEDIKLAAQNTNTLSGYTEIGGSPAVNKFLGNFFLAPGYNWSKIKTVFGQPMFRKGMSQQTRRYFVGLYAKYAAAQLAKRALLVGAMSAGLIDAGDDPEDKVEGDIRSSMFGRFRRLKDGVIEHIDTDAGMFAPWILAAQMATGERKTTTEGEVMKLRGAFDPLQKWFRYKLGPAAGTIADVLSGKDAIGRPIAEDWEDMTPQEKFPVASWHAVKKHFPIPAQELYDEFVKEKIPGGVARTLANFFGMSASAIDREESR